MLPSASAVQTPRWITAVPRTYAQLLARLEVVLMPALAVCYQTAFRALVDTTAETAEMVQLITVALAAVAAVAAVLVVITVSAVLALMVLSDRQRLKVVMAATAV